MKKRIIATTIAMAIGGSMSMAQEIATWSGDRKGAVSFTFDDSAPSHVSDAGPMFDNYGYKATFNLVTNWNPSWEGFQGLADNGHEIASHSKTHNQGMSGEEASSKADISQKITQKYGCLTVAYPIKWQESTDPEIFQECNVSNADAVKQNYIAGRICDHSQHEVPEIMGKDGPSDWAMVPAITTGSEGLEGSENFIQKMQDAVKQNGWVMFLTHGFRGKNNGSATYSPTYIADIDGALQWAKENDSDIWVASFRSTAMYVKERIASKVNKKSDDANSITFEVTHNIKDNVSDYDYPLTIKIKNANNWTNVKAAQSGADIETNIVDDDILVDAVPNAGDVIVYDADAITLPSSSSVAESSAGTQASSLSVAESSASTPKSSASKQSSSSAKTPKSSASSKSSSSTAAIASVNYEATVAVFNENGYITVRDAQGLSITVFNSLGHKVRETRGLGCEQKVYSGAKGMYIVKVGSRIFKTELH